MKKCMLLLLFSLLLIGNYKGFPLLWGCYQKPVIDENDTRSLYERLGGKEALTAVLKNFAKNIAEDERINGFFIGVDLEKVEQKLFEQICEATGGPCTYTGRDMVTVHKGMNITDEQFNAMVEDLIKSLNKFNVGEREKKELLDILGSLKGSIAGI